MIRNNHSLIGVDNEVKCTHHPRLHCTHCFVLCVMWHIGRTMKEVIDAVPRIRSHGCTTIRTCNGFSNLLEISQRVMDKLSICKTCMTFPMSRNKAPGLHILIDSSKQLRAVRISFLESSSISPTGYVALRSAW